MRCEHQSPESGVPEGEGGSEKRTERPPVLLPSRPLHLPPLGAAEGEGPCDRPVGRAGPLHPRCRPARI